MHKIYTSAFFHEFQITIILFSQFLKQASLQMGNLSFGGKCNDLTLRIREQVEKI